MSDRDAGSSSSSQHVRTWQEIAHDLLPSPTSDDSSPSQSYSSLPPAVTAPPRTVTVRDLRNKSCWICTEEDEDPGPTARRRFVHPCKCTLVAHESCLLQWIDQTKANHPLQDTFTCPQCKAPYTLTDTKPFLLKCFELGDRVLTRFVPYGTAATVGGTFLIASTAYGCVAIRMVLGKDAARRALASPWPWHYWFDIPLIPFALIAARLRIFDSAMTWVPTLVAVPVANFPMTTTHWRLMNRYMESRLLSARAYPPSPALTALLVPWLRVFYLALKRKVYKTVLGPFYRRPSQSASTRTRRRRRLVIVGGEANSNHLVDADPPPGAEAVVDGVPDQNDGQDTPQTIYVTHNSLGRLCLGALSLPFVANIMGRLLGTAAGYSQLLARCLGMRIQDQASAPSFLSRFTTNRSAPTTTKSTPSPIASLFRGSLPSYDQDEAEASKSAGKLLYRDQLSLFGPPEYDDLDPVWFRNAVGAGVFIVVKDVSSLLYKFLKLRQRNRTRIVDLPFQGGLVAGLDLRDTTL